MGRAIRPLGTGVNLDALANIAVTASNILLAIMYAYSLPTVYRFHRRHGSDAGEALFMAATWPIRAVWYVWRLVSEKEGAK